MLFRSAKRGAEKLWRLLHDEPFVNALGALTGNQAMQQVKAGLKAIYLSGWQVAADANDGGEMYPDQSLYSVDSVPKVVKRINNTFARADQIQWSEGKNDLDFFAPDGSEGRYKQRHLVYGKAGRPCPRRCGSTIKRLRGTDQRSSFICPSCQKSSR